VKKRSAQVGKQVALFGALIVLVAVIASGWFVDAAFAGPAALPSSLVITGGVTPALYPGADQPIDLGFTNPNSSAVTVEAGALTIAISTHRTGCSASANFAITRGLTKGVIVPAHAHRASLRKLGVPVGDWPVLSMVDTASNQSACHGVGLALTYSSGAP
jgi:hypothetical protein